MSGCFDNHGKDAELERKADALLEPEEKHCEDCTHLQEGLYCDLCHISITGGLGSASWIKSAVLLE
jgi:hypothetical protein